MEVAGDEEEVLNIGVNVNWDCAAPVVVCVVLCVRLTAEAGVMVEFTEVTVLQAGSVLVLSELVLNDDDDDDVNVEDDMGATKAEVVVGATEVIFVNDEAADTGWLDETVFGRLFSGKIEE